MEERDLFSNCVAPGRETLEPTGPTQRRAIMTAMRLARWTAALALCGAIGKASSAEPQVQRDQLSRAAFAPLPTQQRIPVGDPLKIALGRALFFDRRLSRSQRISCASCHDLRTNGASKARTDRGDAGRLTDRNTPTIFNAVYNFRFGWEGRSRSLREFTVQTLTARHLMAGAGLASGRLSSDPKMRSHFCGIYAAAPSDATVADALNAFMTTLVTTDAPFDRWLRGDRAALNPRQLHGFVRFKVLGCASCHQGMNVGGNLFQRRGVFHPLGNAKPDYLRVPSLRNVAVTAPYFHDGNAPTLPEAIRRMARAQLDLSISERDVGDIAAFLATLTGEYEGRPVRPAKPSPSR